MALENDLRDYIAQHGTAAPEVAAWQGPVIVGEIHQFLRSGDAPIRSIASVRLLRELLKNLRFRYFANESFFNAGPGRRGVHDYWQKGTLPPEFNKDDPAQAALDDQEVARRVLTRRFQAVLDDLKLHPRYILPIGSRMMDLAIRDRRLAQHFFEEALDRGIARQTPGVVLLGVSHAAATAFHAGQVTTRMILEKQGYRCVSILLLTDFIRTSDNTIDDAVIPLTGSPPMIRLAGLTAKSPISVRTDHAMPAGKTNPFRQIALEGSDSGRTLAEQFEFVVIQKA
jgi:hypothetical protein